MKNEENMKKGTPKLRVRMFGSLSIEYKDRPLNLSKNSKTKFLQLLALLLVNGDRGIAKKELIEYLYGLEGSGDGNRNLNNLIYRLKKQLISSGLPEEEYVVLERGVCRFCFSYPVCVDVLEFQELVKEAEQGEGEEKEPSLKKAVQLYTGEFLPEFCAELWAIYKNQELKKLYNRAVNEFGAVLRAKGRIKAEGELYHSAARIYPFEEWQVREMDCLIDMKQYDEAYAVYRDTARIYSEELGVPPEGEILDRLHMMERRMLHPEGSFHEIRKVLREEAADGPYFCYFPSFLDSCRVLARAMERNGQSMYLLLCTLEGRSGGDFEDQDILRRQMENLGEAIEETFRKGDLYTRYSKNQYLIILTGTELENGILAFNRLLKKWEQSRETEGKVSYSLESLPNLMAQEDYEPRKKISWGKMEKRWKK